MAGQNPEVRRFKSQGALKRTFAQNEKPDDCHIYTVLCIFMDLPVYCCHEVDTKIY